MTKLARNLTCGYSAVFVLLLVCILIRPAGLAANDGLSYFGAYATTIVPYSAAFLLNAYMYWRAGQQVKSPKYLGPSLKIMAVMLVGLVLTPHTLLDPIHTVFGATLFSLQLIMSAWLVIKNKFDRVDTGLVLSELFAGLMSFYYLPKLHGLLLQWQIIFQVSFAALLVRVLDRGKGSHRPQKVELPAGTSD